MLFWNLAKLYLIKGDNIHIYIYTYNIHIYIYVYIYVYDIYIYIYNILETIHVTHVKEHFIFADISTFSGNWLVLLYQEMHLKIAF